MEALCISCILPYSFCADSNQNLSIVAKGTKKRKHDKSISLHD